MLSRPPPEAKRLCRQLCNTSRSAAGGAARAAGHACPGGGLWGEVSGAVGPPAARGEGISQRQLAAFLTALSVLHLGFGGPLDILGARYLFSTHRTQHLLHAFMAAPLLPRGASAWLVRPVSRWRVGHAVLGLVARPLVGMALLMEVMRLAICGRVGAGRKWA